MKNLLTHNYYYMRKEIWDKVTQGNKNLRVTNILTCTEVENNEDDIFLKVDPLEMVEDKIYVAALSVRDSIRFMDNRLNFTPKHEDWKYEITDEVGTVIYVGNYQNMPGFSGYYAKSFSYKKENEIQIAIARNEFSNFLDHQNDQKGLPMNNFTPKDTKGSVCVRNYKNNETIFVGDKIPEEVREQYACIANHYDFCNHVMNCFVKEKTMDIYSKESFVSNQTEYVHKELGDSNYVEVLSFCYEESCYYIRVAGTAPITRIKFVGSGRSFTKQKNGKYVTCFQISNALAREFMEECFK